MNVIIIADKFQRGMKSRGCVGLIKLKNKKQNYLENQYLNIKKIFPDAKIAYVYGFNAKKIDTFIKKSSLFRDLVLIYNPNYELYNNGYSLQLAKDFLCDDCIVMFGDNVLTKKIFTKFDPIIGSQVFISGPDRTNKLGCITDNKKILHISYNLNNPLSEIYFFNKDACLRLNKILQTGKFKQYFLFELVNNLIDEKYTLSSFIHK